MATRLAGRAGCDAEDLPARARAIKDIAAAPQVRDGLFPDEPTGRMAACDARAAQVRRARVWQLPGL